MPVGGGVGVGVGNGVEQEPEYWTLTDWGVAVNWLPSMVTVRFTYFVPPEEYL